MGIHIEYVALSGKIQLLKEAYDHVGCAHSWAGHKEETKHISVHAHIPCLLKSLPSI